LDDQAGHLSEIPPVAGGDRQALGQGRRGDAEVRGANSNPGGTNPSNRTSQSAS
jgi:hypothetical protein